MPHPLDGARLKVVRAQKHVDVLKKEIGNYLDTHPYEFSFQVNENSGTVTLGGTPAITVAPPLELSCILSECVGPLKHALDYIAWELATRYAQTAPVVGTDRGIFFPILNTATGDGADRFAKMAKKYAFPAGAINVIKGVQPYEEGFEPLGVLNSLTNRDKHCLPLLTGAYAHTAWLELKVVNRTAFGGGVTNLALAISDPAADDTSTPGSTGKSSRSMKVDGGATVFVSLQNSPVPFEPVDRTIEQIVKCVANIIPRFDPFF